MSKQIIINVGLNDSVTMNQRFGTEKYLVILKKVCQNYRVPFSVQLINGGYFHENGQYTEENTLQLTLNDISDELIREIANDLCMFFHQESVMVSVSESEVYFVKENLDKEDIDSDPDIQE